MIKEMLTSSPLQSLKSYVMDYSAQIKRHCDRFLVGTRREFIDKVLAGWLAGCCVTYVQCVLSLGFYII
jgi:hypothetical protein